MKVTIDGKKIEVEGKRTILDVAREKGIFIPSLTYSLRTSECLPCL